jgi:hypothetical protein
VLERVDRLALAAHLEMQLDAVCVELPISAIF